MALQYQFFLINLDRSEDRLARQQEQFTALGLEFTRVVAVDGSTLREPIEGFSAAGYDRRHGKSINPNEIGCYFSHYAAIEAFIASDAEFGIILEDDAALDDAIEHIIDDLLACQDKWDVVNLGGRRNGRPVVTQKLNERHNLVAYTFRQTGAAGYLLNRKAARIYQEKLLPMKVPYDHEFDRAWIYGFKFRGVQPKAVTHLKEMSSTIGYREQASIGGRKKPQWKRGSVFMYRGINEASRLFYYAIRGLLFAR